MVVMIAADQHAQWNRTLVLNSHQNGMGFVTYILPQFLKGKGRTEGRRGEETELQTWVKWTFVNRVVCKHLGELVRKIHLLSPWPIYFCPSALSLIGTSWPPLHHGSRCFLLPWALRVVVAGEPVFEALPACWYPLSSASFQQCLRISSGYASFR